MSRAEVRTRQDLADRAALDADHGSGYCAVFHRAIELIGRRWNGVIIRTLLAGGQRFSDVRAGVPGLSDRLLAELGWTLRSVPHTPKGQHWRLLSTVKELHPAWVRYLGEGAA